jgi:hypothetical protein
MMRILLLLALIIAMPVHADTLLTDAFGMAPDSDSARAGWAGYRESMTGQGAVTAPGTGARVQFYLGAKSLVAGRGQGLAMALVTDANGNLVNDGTGVDFTVADAQHQAITQNGIAAVPFGPFAKAGQFHAGAGIAGQQSTRQEYVVTADLPSVVPALLPQQGAALAEDFHDIATAPLIDRFGNLVSDGSGVTVLLTSADGSTTLLPGVTLGGAAKVKLLVRDIAAEGAMQVNLAGQSSASQPLQMTALRPMGDLALRAVALSDIAATRLVIGPFLTNAGHVLNDGALVSLQITTPRGALPEQTGWVLDGAVSFIALIGPGDFPIDLTVASLLGTLTRRIDAAEAQP